jgi:hypothetical protein
MASGWRAHREQERPVGTGHLYEVHHPGVDRIRVGPPLAEQKRIVAKVEDLMSLLDDLEAKLRKQEQTATRLAESLAAVVAA